MEEETMNIVIAGHVDHGKSTIIGRLLADTGSLPQGKLEQIREKCKRESKVFEYAFLLDALKDEQSQGITIDIARCTFKTKKRRYLILDAPGHIEFLKNMVSGAAKAEAALLVIDAAEGIKENSKRHGYLLSMLGIDQTIVCVNKMDLVGYDKAVFENIKKDISSFLKRVGIKPMEFIPVSALNGDNIAVASKNLAWFKGNTVLSALDSFKKAKPLHEKPFRMPVQDAYKFTAFGDSRRIVAGRVESGTIKIGDEVIFLPSGKRSVIATIEEFNNAARRSISAGYSTGFTLKEQIYVPRGEIMCKAEEKPAFVSSMLRCSTFWMGKQPMLPKNEYKLKQCTSKVGVKLNKILGVVDASTLVKSSKEKIERHDVAECILECSAQIAFDTFNEIKATGRFVIVDGYDIAGGGIIKEFIEDLEAEARRQVLLREQKWDSSLISYSERASRYGQMPKFILITGKTGIDKKTIARHLEKKLFENGRIAYFLGIRNILRGLDADIAKAKRREHVRRLGEVSHILMDAGLIIVATASDLNESDLRLLETINDRESMLIINVGKEKFTDGIIDLTLSPDAGAEKNVQKIIELLKFKNAVFSI